MAEQTKEQVFEAGREVYPGHPTPPGDRDLFSLAGAPFEELVEAFEQPTNRPEISGIPNRYSQIGSIILARTVEHVREGTPKEVAVASVKIAELLARKSGEEKVAGLAVPLATRKLTAALEMLSATSDYDRPRLMAVEITRIREERGDSGPQLPDVTAFL